MIQPFRISVIANLRWTGTVEEVKNFLQISGAYRDATWTRHENNFEICASNGERVFWWPSTGCVTRCIPETAIDQPSADDAAKLLPKASGSSWTAVEDGVHAGETLPMVALQAPRDFIEIVESCHLKGRLKRQADEIASKLQNIRIPAKNADERIAAHFFECGNVYRGFEIMARGWKPQPGSFIAYEEDKIDLLGWARYLPAGVAQRRLLRSLAVQFGDYSAKSWCKERCENFLEQAENFKF